MYAAFEKEDAFKFARKVEHDGRWYQIVVQSAVNSREIIDFDTPIGCFCRLPDDLDDWPRSFYLDSLHIRESQTPPSESDTLYLDCGEDAAGNGCNHRSHGANLGCESSRSFSHHSSVCGFWF